jgi:curved DNA-binding protein CbpA
MRPSSDPYRELGVPRGATEAQVKAAHRRLAKRFHPDAQTGDRQRFLAVQAAYQLLLDPVRRREWDRRHEAGPVRAREAPTRPRSRADGRWTREGGDPARRTTGASRGTDRRAGSGPTGSGRDPGTRTHTWSASGVPWWEDFQPRSRASSDAPGARSTQPGARKTGDDAPGARPATDAARPTAAPDMDVYNRSSGAAWSMAARRHFRRGDADLARGGAFRTRGTQVVTGAEARRVAAEEERARARAEEARRRARAEEEALLRRRGSATAPRQAFEHEPATSEGPGQGAAARGQEPSPGSASGSPLGARLRRILRP